ncbi:MAG: DUF4230 domain-containing protein [Actinomycetota bacterium]
MAKRDGILTSGLRLGVGLSIFAIALIGISALGLLPGLPNPFETNTVDRNRPVLLESLEDVSEYTAARGNFEVLVDSEEDARYFPSAVLGERTVLAAVGEVGATVDFGALSDGAVQVDGDSVTITLPQPVLDEARLDNEETEVIDRDRGLLNRIGGVFSGDPVNDQDLYVAAENKLEQSARDSELLERAEDNTRKMLRALVTDLGYEDVTVVFEPPPGERA